MVISMKIVGDTHTHTVACGHATGTLTENAMYAAKKGHRFVAITEHSGDMPGAPIYWFFNNMLWHLPPMVEGIFLLKGIEANIVNIRGELDFPEEVMAKLDIVIASVHFSENFEHGDFTAEDYTNMYCRAALNPLIDIIGHCDDPRFEFDEERIVRAFRENDKIVEFNAASQKSRIGSEAKCRRILELCKRYGAKVTVASDAHAAQGVGEVQSCIDVLRELNFPEELVVNADYDRFCKEMHRRKGLQLI